MLTRQKWAYARTLCTSGKKLSFTEEDRTSLPLTLIFVPFSMIPIAAGGEYLSCSLNKILKITVHELLRGHVVSLPACLFLFSVYFSRKIHSRSKTDFHERTCEILSDSYSFACEVFVIRSRPQLQDYGLRMHDQSTYFVFFAMKCRNRFIEHSLQLSVNTCLQYCKKRQRLSNTTWLWNFNLCFEVRDLEKEMYFVDLGDLGDRRSWLSWRLLIFGYLGDHRSWRRLQNEPVVRAIDFKKAENGLSKTI